MRRFLLLFGSSAPLLFLFWLVFVGNFSEWDLLLGAAVAIAGAVAICIVEHADEEHFRPQLRDFVQVVFVLWLFVQGTYEILWVSLRDFFGGRKAVSAFRVVEFKAGRLKEPHDTARRVFAVAYTTMAPNFIVLGINTRERQLLFHQIERSSVPTLTKNLGAVA